MGRETLWAHWATPTPLRNYPCIFIMKTNIKVINNNKIYILITEFFNEDILSCVTIFTEIKYPTTGIIEIIS